jgi:hypothetical protein
MPSLRSSRGVFDLSVGQQENGTLLLEQAVHLAQQTGERLALQRAQAVLAECEILIGNANQARSRLLPLLGNEELSETFSMPLLVLLAWAESALGHHEQASQRAGTAIARARSQQFALFLPESLSIQALLFMNQPNQDMAKAELALQEAISLARTMPYPYAEAKALYVYGHLHASKGEPEQARETYQAALGICARLGERPYAERIERALQELPNP